MKNYIRIAFTMSLLAGFAGAAVAGDDKAKAPTPAPTPAAKPAPGAKAPTPAPPAGDKAAAAQMQMPKAAPEVAAAAKAMAGTWKCKGQTFMPDGTAAPMTATMKTKVALDGFWAQSTLAETGKRKGAYKFESFRTYDGKKWHSVMVDNMGSSEVAMSDGPKENKVMWEASSRGPMGESKARHYEETVGKELKMWGEWSMDKGKTWIKGYEVSCKK